MSDSVLQHFAQKKSAGQEPAEPIPGATDDCGAFGMLRGAQERALMLQVRRKDGSVTAFAYAWLERAELDPSEGIALKFAGQTVKVIGRNLNAEVRPNLRLFEGLVRHRVPWIQEADEPTALGAARQAVVIESVSIGT